MYIRRLFIIAGIIGALTLLFHQQPTPVAAQEVGERVEVAFGWFDSFTNFFRTMFGGQSSGFDRNACSINFANDTPPVVILNEDNGFEKSVSIHIENTDEDGVQNWVISMVSTDPFSTTPGIDAYDLPPESDNTFSVTIAKEEGDCTESAGTVLFSPIVNYRESTGGCDIAAISKTVRVECPDDTGVGDDFGDGGPSGTPTGDPPDDPPDVPVVVSPTNCELTFDTPSVENVVLQPSNGFRMDAILKMSNGHHPLEGNATQEWNMSVTLDSAVTVGYSPMSPPSNIRVDPGTHFFQNISFSVDARTCVEGSYPLQIDGSLRYIDPNRRTWRCTPESILKRVYVDCNGDGEGIPGNPDPPDPPNPGDRDCNIEDDKTKFYELIGGITEVPKQNLTLDASLTGNAPWQYVDMTMTNDHTVTMFGLAEISRYLNPMGWINFFRAVWNGAGSAPTSTEIENAGIPPGATWSPGRAFASFFSERIDMDSFLQILEESFGISGDNIQIASIDANSAGYNSTCEIFYNEGGQQIVVGSDVIEEGSCSRFGIIIIPPWTRVFEEAVLPTWVISLFSDWSGGWAIPGRIDGYFAAVRRGSNISAFCALANSGKEVKLRVKLDPVLNPHANDYVCTRSFVKDFNINLDGCDTEELRCQTKPATPMCPLYTTCPNGYFCDADQGRCKCRCGNQLLGSFNDLENCGEMDCNVVAYEVDTDGNPVFALSSIDIEQGTTKRIKLQIHNRSPELTSRFTALQLSTTAELDSVFDNTPRNWLTIDSCTLCTQAVVVRNGRVSDYYDFQLTADASNGRPCPSGPLKLLAKDPNDRWTCRSLEIPVNITGCAPEPPPALACADAQPDVGSADDYCPNATDCGDEMECAAQVDPDDFRNYICGCVCKTSGYPPSRHEDVDGDGIGDCPVDGFPCGSDDPSTPDVNEGKPNDIGQCPLDSRCPNNFFCVGIGEGDTVGASCRCQYVNVTPTLCMNQTPDTTQTNPALICPRNAECLGDDRCQYSETQDACVCMPEVPCELTYPECNGTCADGTCGESEDGRTCECSGGDCDTALRGFGDLSDSCDPDGGGTAGDAGEGGGTEGTGGGGTCAFPSEWQCFGRDTTGSVPYSARCDLTGQYPEFQTNVAGLLCGSTTMVCPGDNDVLGCCCGEPVEGYGEEDDNRDGDQGEYTCRGSDQCGGTCPPGATCTADTNNDCWCLMTAGFMPETCSSTNPAVCMDEGDCPNGFECTPQLDNACGCVYRGGEGDDDPDGPDSYCEQSQAPQCGGACPHQEQRCMPNPVGNGCICQQMQESPTNYQDVDIGVPITDAEGNSLFEGSSYFDALQNVQRLVTEEDLNEKCEEAAQNDPSLRGSQGRMMCIGQSLRGFRERSGVQCRHICRKEKKNP